MKTIQIPSTLFNSPFVVYGIDTDCSYDVDDMIGTNIADVKITQCDNPKEWIKDNLGFNETPIVLFDGKTLQYHRIYSVGYVVSAT